MSGTPSLLSLPVIDAHGQLLAGLRAFLTTVLGDSVPLGAIRDAYDDAQLVSALSLQSANRGRLVIIGLGDSKPSTGALGGTGPTRLRPPPDPLLPNAPTEIVLTEVGREQTAVRLIVLAAGDGGKTVRDYLAQRIRAATGTQVTIPLPDSLTTPTIVDPALTRYGLTATLIKASEHPEDGGDATRGIYRHQLLYQATSRVYRADTLPVVRRVLVTALFEMPTS